MSKNKETFMGRDGVTHTVTRCTACGVILDCTRCGAMEPRSALRKDRCRHCGTHTLPGDKE